MNKNERRRKNIERSGIDNSGGSNTQLANRKLFFLMSGLFVFMLTYNCIIGELLNDLMSISLSLFVKCVYVCFIIRYVHSFFFSALICALPTFRSFYLFAPCRDFVDGESLEPISRSVFIPFSVRLSEFK